MPAQPPDGITLSLDLSKEKDYVHVTNVSKVTADASNGSARPHKATRQLDTAQQAESSRENCKRVRASGPVSPEVSVAALTLNESDQQESRQQESAVDLRLVKLLLSRGKPRDALFLLHTIITANTSNADALCLRGQCYMAEHDKIQAFASFAAALTINPSHLEALLAYAAVQKACGQLLDALKYLAKAYSVHPADARVQQAYATALTAWGTTLKASGKSHEALAKYQEAVAVCADYAAGYYDLGVYYSEIKQFGEAQEQYELCLGLRSDFAEAHCNLGVLHHIQGDLDKALACYQQAYAHGPGLKLVHDHMAMACTDKATHSKVAGNLQAAIQLYEQALAYNPRYVRAVYDLGVAYAEAGQQDKAVFMYNMAITLEPTFAEAFNNLAVIMRERGNLEIAVKACQAALQIRPAFPQCLNNLATIYTAQGRALEALHLLQAALLAWPEYAEAHNNLGVLQRDLGAIPEALLSYEKCLEHDADNRNSGQNRLLALNYIHPGEDEHVCTSHAEWGSHFQDLFTPLPPQQPQDYQADLSTPLIVGYISPDLFTHSVSYFAQAPITHHHSAAVKHIVYSCVSGGDSKTEMLRTATQAAGGVWKDVAKLSEPELAKLVRADGVQVLVELTGHTANNRLGVMAMQAAPVQITWIGYPNSTGLQTVQYRLTDALCDPYDTKQTFVEELVRLPKCFLCYTPATDAPEVAPLPALANGFVTFASFNNMAKITPEVIKLWATILQAVPSARLLLKNKPFACAAARQHVTQLFVKEGIGAERIDLMPLAIHNADHLAMYGEADISLDTFPYAGTTTTCESLYMGVPCVSLKGACHAQNVGVSLMTAVDLADAWIADSQEQYISIALAAAKDLDKLSQLRQQLRQQMLGSPLCDAEGFVTDLEHCYRELWTRWQSAPSAGTEGSQDRKLISKNEQTS